jgi:hypothetical protein
MAHTPTTVCIPSRVLQPQICKLICHTIISPRNFILQANEYDHMVIRITKLSPTRKIPSSLRINICLDFNQINREKASHNAAALSPYHTHTHACKMHYRTAPTPPPPPPLLKILPKTQFCGQLDAK